jgi:hypothetical protein
MIGAHAAGIQHTYRKINKILAKCFVCRELSECQILKYEKSTHIFYFKVKTLDEQFIFDWKKCNHRAVLYNKEDVFRYKTEQEGVGFISVPYYQNMKLNLTEMPKKVPAIIIVIVVILSVAFGVGLAILLDKLGIPFLF